MRRLTAVFLVLVLCGVGASLAVGSMGLLSRLPGIRSLASCPRGAHAYASWEEMLDREELDALWVCTPPLHHRGPTLAALASGIHVYLEKPIARTLDDAEAIVSAARSADAVCAVGYQWHASELVDEARQALDGQRVAMLVGRNYGPVAARPWFMDRARGGGQILERGSHHIDLQRVIAGDISAVQAVAASERLAQAETEASIDDAIMLLFHFESGALGSGAGSFWVRDDVEEVVGVALWPVVEPPVVVHARLKPGRIELLRLQRGVVPVPEQEGELLPERLLDLRRGGDVGADEVLSEDGAHVPVARASRHAR